MLLEKMIFPIMALLFISAVVLGFTFKSPGIAQALIVSSIFFLLASTHYLDFIGYFNKEEEENETI